MTRPPLPFHRLLTVSVPLLMAFSLLALGAPRLMGAVSAFPANAIMERIKLRKPVTEHDLAVLIDAQGDAISWHETSKRWADQGLAHLMLANRQKEEPAQKAHYEQADQALRRSLSLGPANAFAWSRLAYVDMKQSPPSPRAASMLIMSIKAAPYNPRLVFTRLELCFIAWPHFEKQARPKVLDQVRFAWKLNPKRLVAVANRLGRTGAVRAALLEDPEGFLRFSQMLRELRAKKRP